jgi:hypothetical protein
MSLNHTPSPVYASQYESILNKFPIQYRDKLRFYTLQELFYIYKLATYKMREDKDIGGFKSGELFYNALKTRLFAWLKGEYNEYFTLVKPIPPTSLDKIGRRFNREWNKFASALDATMPTEKLKENTEALKQHFSKVA